MEDNRISYIGHKRIFYVIENNDPDYIQNINDFTDEQIDIIDSYNKDRNKEVIKGFTRSKMVEMLNEHEDSDYIYGVEVIGKGYNCFEDIPPAILKKILPKYFILH